MSVSDYKVSGGNSKSQENAMEKNIEIAQSITEYTDGKNGMRRTTRKISRRHGWMVLRSYAPGDGSIDFNWASERDQNGNSIDEPVTESDVSEWLRMPENSNHFGGWGIIIIGKSASRAVPRDVRLAPLVERPFGTNVRLFSLGVEYEYIYHGDLSDSVYYDSKNTTFYFANERRKTSSVVSNAGITAGLCFFLNHETDFELSGFKVRSNCKPLGYEYEI